jgi:hypothetical protein
MAVSRVNRTQEILLKAGLIDTMQLASAIAHQNQFGGRLVSIVAELGFADEEVAAAAVAKGLGLPLLHLGTVVSDPKALAKVSAEMCERDAVFPVSLKDRVLTLAMVDPTDLKTVDGIVSAAGTRIVTGVATESQLRAAIAKHYYQETIEPKPPSRQRQVITSDTPVPKPRATGVISEFEFDDDRPGPTPPQGHAGANTMLDEMFDVSRLNWSEDAQRRLDTVRATQTKITGIVRALQALLREKGLW